MAQRRKFMGSVLLGFYPKGGISVTPRVQPEDKDIS